MGTRSIIGYKNSDGSVTTTYCHYDGYPNHNGRVLRKKYNSDERAKAVASAGYLSVLRKQGDLEFDISESVNSEKPVVYSSVDKARKYVFTETWAEYFYLWDDGSWYIAGHTADSALEDLEALLASRN